MDDLDIAVSEKLYASLSEEALICSVLIDPAIFSGIDIQTDDFYHREHRIIWSAISELNKAGSSIDYITLCNKLEDDGRIGAIGGASEITRILLSTVTSYHAEAYASIIKDKSKRRKLLDIGRSMIQSSLEDQDINNSLPVYIQKIIGTISSNSSSRDIGGYLSDLYDTVTERSKSPIDNWGIPSKFPLFDRVTGGFQKSELTLISGSPGIGKSLFVFQVGTQMAETCPGAFFSIEMRAEDLVRRLVSGSGSIDTRAMQTGRMEEQDWHNFANSIDRLSRLPIHIDESARWNTTSLRAELTKLKITKGIEWFVLDYLFLLQDGLGKDEVERTAMASAGLKSICKELNIAGIVVHSQVKTGIGNTDGIPGQESLRGSGQVIYDADLILFLTKYIEEAERYSLRKVDHKYRDNMRILWFGKGRNLVDARKFILMVKRDQYPYIGEYSPEDIGR